MSRSFRPEPEASAELEYAALWYEGERPGLGVEFLDAIDATLDRITRWPEAAPRVRGVPADVPARKAPVSGFPYHIAYLVMPDAIRILAFAHDNRRTWVLAFPSQNVARSVSPTTLGVDRLKSFAANHAQTMAMATTVKSSRWLQRRGWLRRSQSTAERIATMHERQLLPDK